MAKTEARKLNHIVDDIVAVAEEWQVMRHVKPGSDAHKIYVKLLLKLVYESELVEE